MAVDDHDLRLAVAVDVEAERLVDLQLARGAEELGTLSTHYAGRPSPLYFAERITEKLGGAKVYFKRDELNHTGAHKINNCIGQILLAMRMGKTRIIAETGAGQHGVATATVCARDGSHRDAGNAPPRCDGDHEADRGTSLAPRRGSPAAGACSTRRLIRLPCPTRRAR